MRYTLNEEELKITLDLLLNKYDISTNFLNKLYGRKQRDNTEAILLALQYIDLDRNYLCRLILIREGANLFAGSEPTKKELRLKILEKMPDRVVEELYSKYLIHRKI